MAELNYDIFSPEVGLDAWLQAPLDAQSSLASLVDPAVSANGVISATGGGSSPNVQSTVDAMPTTPTLQDPVEGAATTGDVLSGAETGAVLAYGKKTFDDTTEGWMQGLDSNDEYKWALGSVAANISYNVNTANALNITLNSATASNALYIEDASNSSIVAVDIRRSVGTGSGIYVQCDSPAGYCVDLLQSSNTPAIHAVSDGSGSSVVPLQLENQTATSTNYWKVAEYRGGSTPDVSVTHWVGTTSPDGVLTANAGSICHDDGGALYVNTDGSTAWTDVGASSLSMNVTSGKAFDAGIPVAMESDGKVWPVRLLEGSSDGSETTFSIGEASDENQRYARPQFLDLSDTVKLLVVHEDGGYDYHLARFVVDPSDGTISSVSNTTLTLDGTATDAFSFDVKKLTENKAVIIWEEVDGADTNTRAKVLDCTSGITQGSISTIVTNSGGFANNGVAVTVEDSSKVFFWYVDKSNAEIRARYATISGTTISLSTTNSFSASTTDDQIRGAGTYEGASHHILAWSQNAYTQQKFVCASNSGGTLTFGNSVDVGTGNDDLSTYYNFAPGDGTTVCSINNYNTGALIVNYFKIISRSGTALTVTHYGSPLSTTALGSWVPSLVHFGQFEYGTIQSENSGDERMVFISVNGTDVTVGSDYERTPANYKSTVMCPFTADKVLISSSSSSNVNNIAALPVTCTHNNEGYIGISDDAATDEDETIAVSIGGKNSDVSGLTAGTRYYTNPGGVLTSTRTDGARTAGVAETATSLIVQT